MKKIVVLIVILSFIQNAIAQSAKTANPPAIDLLYTKIGTYTDSLFQHTDRLNKCISGYMFIRFNINKKGDIINIQSNEGTPDFLDSIFREALQPSTSQLKREATNNKSYLLPVLYNLHNNCPIDTNVQKPGTLNALLKTLPKGIEPTKEGYVYSFMNMLNFEKTKEMSTSKNYQAIQYFILAPYKLISPYR
jgi:hypothetical protein